jgi:hypothetical protein
MVNQHHPQGSYDIGQMQDWFNRLKTKGLWGAKSPDNKKIVAMTAALNALKVLEN